MQCALPPCAMYLPFAQPGWGQDVVVGWSEQRAGVRRRCQRGATHLRRTSLLSGLDDSRLGRLHKTLPLVCLDGSRPGSPSSPLHSGRRTSPQGMAQWWRCESCHRWRLRWPVCASRHRPTRGSTPRMLRTLGTGRCWSWRTAARPSTPVRHTLCSPRGCCSAPARDTQWRACTARSCRPCGSRWRSTMSSTWSSRPQTRTWRLRRRGAAQHRTPRVQGTADGGTGGRKRGQPAACGPWGRQRLAAQLAPLPNLSPTDRC